MPDEKEDKNNDSELDYLLQKIFAERGLDFRDYKKSTLKRRIQKRLTATRKSSYEEYAGFLDIHDDEYVKLFNDLLINVTEFFRDPEAWEVIENEVIPDMFLRKKKGDAIKVWSASCATGEEAYTISILLAEKLGDAIKDYEIRIYATDIDEDALAVARRGIYKPEKLKNVSPLLLDKYFTKENDSYRINRSVRQMVTIGRQDLITDSPISHLDLLICRNVLIYFNNSLQKRLLSRFVYSVNTGGYVFFGKSEKILRGSELFRAVNLSWRIFQKIADPVYTRPVQEHNIMPGADSNNSTATAFKKDNDSCVKSTGYVTIHQPDYHVGQR